MKFNSDFSYLGEYDITTERGALLLKKIQLIVLETQTALVLSTDFRTVKAFRIFVEGRRHLEAKQLFENRNS